jgi:DNA-binding beta-propeller fold protein YncE
MQTAARTRRDFLALAGAVAASFTLRPFESDLWAAPRGDISIADAARIDLLPALGRALDRNVLKLFRVVADASRNRLYVTGIMSQYIAVLDGDTHAPIQTVDTGIAGSAIKYLVLDDVANRLYIRDTTNNQLLAIDLNTGGRIGPVPFSGLAGGMVADSNRGLLFYVSQDAPTLRALNGGDFSTIFTSSGFGSSVTSLLFDPADDVLYGLESTRGQGRIYKLSMADHAVTTISFGMTATASARAFQWSPAERRFFVAVPALGVLVVSATGQVERSLAWPSGVDFLDLSLDANRGRLFANFLETPAEGEVAGTGCHLWTYDGRDWKEAAVFGKKPYGVVANSATGRFYAPAGDESAVWWGEATATSAAGLRVGDSIESVVPASGGQVYMNSRLGGSHLVAFDPATRAVSSFTAGTWPVAMCVNAAATSMVVLNAWDSTLSVFELPSNRLTATIPIGLAAGTTDRLPDLAVDFSRGRAYASYPEFARIAVVDFHNGRALDSIAIADLVTGDTGGGPNQVEVAVSETAGRLLVLCGSLRRLSAYDITGTAPRLLADSTTPPPSSSERNGWKVLFVDVARDRAFVGADVFDARTGRSLGIRMGAGQRVFASDDVRDVYWTATIENETIAVQTLDRSSLAVLDTQTLGPADYYSPGLGLDAQRGRLYVAHLTAATFDEYVIG